MNKRKAGRFYIRGLEEFAFVLDVVPLPKLSSRAIPKLYREANRVRRELGIKPKQYFTIKNRRLTPIKGVT